MGILAKALVCNTTEGNEAVLAANTEEAVVLEQMNQYRSYFTNVAASPSVSDEDSAKIMGVIRSLKIIDVMVTPVEAI